MKRQYLGPDAFGALGRFCDCTNFRHSKKIEQTFQIGWLSKPRCWHTCTWFDDFGQPRLPPACPSVNVACGGCKNE
jgi:hypothetical protein